MAAHGRRFWRRWRNNNNNNNPAAQRQRKQKKARRWRHQQRQRSWRAHQQNGGMALAAGIIGGTSHRTPHLGLLRTWCLIVDLIPGCLWFVDCWFGLGSRYPCGGCDLPADTAEPSGLYIPYPFPVYTPTRTPLFLVIRGRYYVATFTPRCVAYPYPPPCCSSLYTHPRLL